MCELSACILGADHIGKKLVFPEAWRNLYTTLLQRSRDNDPLFGDTMRGRAASVVRKPANILLHRVLPIVRSARSPGAYM